MRLPGKILRTACLLGFKKETPHYAGSGLVVAVPGARGDSHFYLVTSKSVAERMDCCPILIGLNYKDGRKAILEADTLPWYFHPTETIAVDAAVTPFAATNWDLLDIEPVPERLFASGEMTRNGSIAVGDEITAVSAFTRFSWEDDRHFPIVRTGHLSMIPTLRLPVRHSEPMDAYVAEIAGLSGSPIWTQPTAGLYTAQKEDGQTNPSPQLDDGANVIFLGLLHGTWEVPDGAMKGQTAPYTKNMTSGMSIIVPAHKILEVINQPELASLRKKNDEQTPMKSIFRPLSFGETDTGDYRLAGAVNP